MQIPLLNDVVIIFGLAIVVIFACHQLRIPTIVGFLLAGFLAGPHGLGLIENTHEVELLSEIGVVLLLFTIGIEFSFTSLSEIRTVFLVGGLLQVFLTALAGTLFAVGAGRPLNQSVFIGFVLALSSTAIVLKLLQEQAQVESPHGRTTLGILVFQDIAVVPMMLWVGLWGNMGKTLSLSLESVVTKGAAVILGLILAAKWVVPQILYQAARLRDRELFLASVVLIVLGVAWLTSTAGLSLALGAFLAGLIISRSEYSHRVLGDFLPFRDVFISFFFVAIGMLLDLGFVAKHLGWILLMATAVIAAKSLFAGLPTLLLGFPLRTAILVGLSLGQIGEFSFLLLKRGLEYNLLADDLYQLLLGMSVVTMIATPFLIAAAPAIAEWVLGLPLPRRLRADSSPASEAQRPADLQDHVIIVGFGLNGQNLARAAFAANIPYMIIDLNPQTIRRERKLGQPILYGDATQRAILEHAGIVQSRVLVVAISDPTATRRIVEIARRLSPRVTIIARTRFLSEMQPLYKLGADEVVPEEFETSVEIFTRVLAKYFVPRDRIETLTEELRAQGYKMLRDLSREATSFADLDLHIPDHEIATFQVHETSPVRGKSLAEMDLRKQYGVTLLAIRRSGEIIANPGGDVRLEQGDVLVLLGPTKDMATVCRVF